MLKDQILYPELMGEENCMSQQQYSLTIVV